ncbi:unnamed protein product [marine sediment metagenome]|uniref:DUF5678 domain-containing protein n=1 Tax=marine sediment metagenome TaxID=412755 RepID=X0WTT9_9ZZZZ
MSSPLEKEFEYYLENQEQLVAKYDGKVLVIKNRQVIGVYDSEQDAIATTTREHELGTFLVQKCEPGADSCTQTFHSRVAFA